MALEGPFAPFVLAGLGAILVVAGLVLAFRGRALWRTLMALLGALVGAVLGFLIGATLGGLVGALLLGLVGAVVGALLFAKLVRVGLALLAGVLAGGLTFVVLAGPGAAGVQAVLAFGMALVVLILVALLAFRYMEPLIGVLTAFIGGFLVGGGTFLALRLVPVPPPTASLVALAAAGGVFVLGALSQGRRNR